MKKIGTIVVICVKLKCSLLYHISDLYIHHHNHEISHWCSELLVALQVGTLITLCVVVVAILETLDEV